jgi:hypothetical protein
MSTVRSARSGMSSVIKKSSFRDAGPFSYRPAGEYVVNLGFGLSPFARSASRVLPLALTALVRRDMDAD